MFGRWTEFILVVVVSALGVSIFSESLANNFPPLQTKHFYGDADGDATISGLDLIVHRNMIGGKPYHYDTLQPAGPSSDWNTCDVDSDRSCSGLDLIILKNALASISVITADKPWTMSAPNLPISYAQWGRWIPFNINVSSLVAGLPSGRPGLSVVASINPSSVGTGKLRGRNCDPEPGIRDQPSPDGAQCAIAVTVTDWPTSTENGLTESGAFGFSVWSNGDGDLTLDFRVEADPGLDIPLLTYSVTMSSFQPPCIIDLACSSPVNEENYIYCTATYSNCFTPLTLVPSMSCFPIWINDYRNGTADIVAFAMGETSGPGTCEVGVESIYDGVAEFSTVTIDEVPATPSITLSCPASRLENQSIPCGLTVTDPDIPVTPVTCTKDPSTSCTGVVVPANCSSFTIPAQGEASPSACTVQVNVVDSTMLTTSMQNSIAINEAHTAPTWTSAPGTVTVGPNVPYNGIFASATDPDLPNAAIGNPGYLTCSKVSTTCSFGVTVSGTGAGNVSCNVSFNAPAFFENCTVSVKVQDSASYNVTGTLNLNIYIPPRVFYVNDDAPAGGDGLSWATAFQKVQSAVDAAWQNCEVWVAEGTYVRPNPSASSVVYISKKVKLYGGFIGTENLLSERVAPWAYPAIIDGENLATNGVYAYGFNSDFILDGFTITNTTTRGIYADRLGNNSTINKCIIDTPSYAARIRYSNKVNITNSIIRNSYYLDIYNSVVDMDNVLMLDARNEELYLASSTVKITNSTFVDYNSYSVVYVAGSSQLEMRNSIVWGAGSDLIALYGASTVTITNSDIKGGYIGTGNLNINPMFMGGGDYRLHHVSQLIDQANPSYASATDMDGNPRPYGSAPDIGAYESQVPPQCGIVVACDPIVSENAALTCDIGYNPSLCTGTPALSATNTCTGASVTDLGGGRGLYSLPAQGEAFGPGACIASAELVSDNQSSSASVVISEANMPPLLGSVPPYITVLSGEAFSGIVGSFTDSDLPNTSSSDPGHLSCTLAGTDCMFPSFTVSGEGDGNVDCNLSFDPVYGYTTCWVNLEILDGYSASQWAYFTIEIVPPPMTIYVDADAPPLGNGYAWETAYNTIQEAVNAAWPGCQIWVAEGRYTDSSGYDTTPVIELYTHDISIYGGFQGNETSLAERGHPWMRPTIIDGENTKETVVRTYGANNLVLDGFIVTGGYALDGYYGAGIGIYWSNDSKVSNCIVRNNVSESGAAGLSADYSWRLVLSNNLLYDNTDLSLVYERHGGAIDLRDTDGKLINSTIADNMGATDGAAVAVYHTYLSTAEFEIKNSIIKNNAFYQLGNGDLYTDAANLSVNYSDLGNTVYPGTGNISLDPMFVSTPERNYHLQAGSPCIDAGDPDPYYNDTDGSRNDMGAYGWLGMIADTDNDGLEDWWEMANGLDPNDPSDAVLDGDGDNLRNLTEFAILSNPNGYAVRYIDDSATGANDGTSWADAFNVIQDAMDVAEPGDMLWVANGIYMNESVISTKEVLVMKEGTQVYGGFNGTESSLSERLDPGFYSMTVLDGLTQSWHVVDMASFTTLDGFAVRNGQGEDGAGILVATGAIGVKIANMWIKDNNSWLGNGSGLGIFGGTIEITDSLFESNESSGWGGAIYASFSDLKVQQSLFINNNVVYCNGGAIAALDSPVYVSNSIFASNSAPQTVECGGSGGAIWAGNLEVINSVFYENYASKYGNAIASWDNLRIKNSIFWNNSGGLSNDEIYSYYGTEDITYTDLQYYLSGGVGNISADPLFVDPLTFDFHLGVGSPAIDAGDPDPMYNDNDATRNDMGAYGGPY